jgi:hypothetical protein
MKEKAYLLEILEETLVLDVDTGKRVKLKQGQHYATDDSDLTQTLLRSGMAVQIAPVHDPANN